MMKPFLLTDIKAERMTLENLSKVPNEIVAFPIGASLPPSEQVAFDKACEAEYIRFLNVRVVSMVLMPGRPPVDTACACYTFTDKGRARLKELRERERVEKLTGGAP